MNYDELNCYDEVVIGGGIAALTYAWSKKIMCLTGTGISFPPMCAYLHKTKKSLQFLDSLGLVPELNNVVQCIIWKGNFDFWPGPAEAKQAYFEKTRLREVEITKFYSDKASTSNETCCKLQNLYTQLYQVLNLNNLIADIRVSRVLRLYNGNYLVVNETDGSILAAKKVAIACPPEMLGIQRINDDKHDTMNYLNYYQLSASIEQIPDIMYVCDKDTLPYRISKASQNSILVEYACKVNETPNEEKLVDDTINSLKAFYGYLPKQFQGMKRIKQQKVRGYYERTYDLPEGVTLVGRASCGTPKLTHNLIEDYFDE